MEQGTYIVNGPGHCIECHTPRNILGGLDHDRHLSGNPEGLGSESIPALQGVKNNRISNWTKDDIVFSLRIGMIPDGDFPGGSMGQVIENTTSRLTEADLDAIAEYLNDL